MESCEINRIRNDLMQGLDHIATMTNAVLNNFSESTGNFPDVVDTASIQSEMEYACNKLNREGLNKSRILIALKKIDNGSYGICEQCEEHIPVKRLNALPDAKYCLKCQKEMEKASYC